MSKTRFCSICIFLSVLFSASRAYASDYFPDALRIYSEGKYFEASIEFERAIFYENDAKRIALYKYYKALCYKKLGNNARALDELNSLNMRTLPDSLFLPVQYEHALCSYLNNDINQALMDINGVRMQVDDAVKIMPFIPLQILCLNAGRQWGEARALWDYYLGNSGLSDSVLIRYRAAIQELYKKRNIPRYRSPEKAENLSRFFPGSGQMYSGAAGEGSVNFLIHLSLLGYAFYQFYTGYYCTGYLVGLGLFVKFYSGGIHRAGILAAENNAAGIRAFNAENSSLMTALFHEKSCTVSGKPAIPAGPALQ